MTCCHRQSDGDAAAAGATEDVRRLLPGGPTGAVLPLNLGISNVSSGAASYIVPQIGVATLRDSLEWERWTAAAGAGSTAGHRTGSQLWSRAPDFGGFRIHWVVALGTLVNNGASGFRGYVGLAAQSAVLASVSPFSFTNIVGFAFSPSDTPEWFSLRNDGVGGAIGNATGIAVNATDVYRFQVEADEGGSEFRLEMENLTTAGGLFSITYNSNLPAATLLLSDNVWLNSNGDATTSATVDVAEIVARRPALWTP